MQGNVSTTSFSKCYFPQICSPNLGKSIFNTLCEAESQTKGKQIQNFTSHRLVEELFRMSPSESEFHHTLEIVILCFIF